MVVKFQVFKKGSLNGKLTLFLTKRDFFDHVTQVDPIEGVLVVNPSSLRDEDAYVQLALSFRFGRESDESMGYNFVRTMYLETTKVYPPEKDIPVTDVQRNLISKLGNFAFPFRLTFPRLASPSYQMQKGWEDDGSLMGVDYEVMAFVGPPDAVMNTRSTSRLLIRRLSDIPPESYESTSPTGTMTKSFLTCSGTVTLEASISSKVFRPDDEIAVKLSLTNKSSREIKRLKVKVVQISEVPMFSETQKRDKTLLKVDEGVLLPPGACTTREYTHLKASVPARQARGAVFLQGSLRPDAAPVLAASTLLPKDVCKKDVFGIVVSYAVRVKATLGALFGDVVLDVPFVLEAPYQ